jgi:predicted dehydrogenase
VVNLLNQGFIKIPLDVHVGVAAPPPPRGSWYLKREMGGGCLFDMGAHGIDLLCHCFGEGRVSSAFFESLSGVDADVAASVSIEIGTDVKAYVEADWRYQRLEKSLKIRSENGFMSADSMTSVLNVSQPRVTLGKRVGQFTLRFEQRISEYWNEVWEFVESVRSNKASSALANGEDGLRALRIVEEAYRHFSERKGDGHG